MLCYNSHCLSGVGNVSVTLEGWKQVCPDFLVRTLRARCGQTTRTIRQFHYTTWPDHGVPAIISPIIELVRLVRDCQPSEALPVLVHCSAGCGRTGTFCAIDYVHGLVRYGKLNSNLSLFKIIQEMRQQRVAMVCITCLRRSRMGLINAICYIHDYLFLL